MHQLSCFVAQIQDLLFPRLEEVWGPLTDLEKDLVKVLEVLHIEKFVPAPVRGGVGRPEIDRRPIARAFVAMSLLKLTTRRALINALQSSPHLRRICGWERASEIPAEASFCRVFKELADGKLPQRCHEALVREAYNDRLVGHISRDSTAIEVRQHAKKGKAKSRSDNENRIERQSSGLPLDEMIADLPTAADWGAKRNSRGNFSFWFGFKLHVDWDDAMTPISCVLTSASTHDSQAAIPLATMSDQRVTNLYDLMDAAYDSNVLRAFSESLGHVPIIDINSRGTTSKRQQLSSARVDRLRERSVAERGFSCFKDSFGGRNIYVRGHAKVFTHIMFGLLALAAQSLIRYVS